MTKLFLLAILVATFTSCNLSHRFAGTYELKNSIQSGSLILNRDHTYNFDLSSFEQHEKQNKGTWNYKNRCIYLNSYNQPKDYGIIKVQELIDSHIDPDSIYLQLYSINEKSDKGGDTLEISNALYDLLSVEVNNYGDCYFYNRKLKRISIYKKNIEFFIFTQYPYDYPLYRIKNKNANLFKIYINKKYWNVNNVEYEYYDYFSNKKLQVSKDTLILDRYEKFFKPR